MFVYILLFFLIAALASIAVMLVFGMRKNKTLRTIVAITLVCSVLSFGMCMIAGSIVNSDIDRCRAEYQDLMLYYSTVDNSTNEYVRYDYYNKVQEYNEWYNSLCEWESDFWLNTMVPTNWSDGFGLIDFQLHGDDYGAYAG